MQAHQMSYPRHHCGAMQRIRLDTFRAMLENEHELACYCPGWRHWASTDLTASVRAGIGDRLILTCKPRCRKRANVGERQVRPPTRRGPNDWPLRSS